MIVALAVRAGLDWRAALLFAVAVLAGELSIGWSNDFFDADRDARGGRTDKPIVAGTIGRRTVAIAGFGALALAVALCFAIGPATGLINLIMMAAGWAYNGGLKSTLASGLMYVIGFGLIPALSASTLPDHPAARPVTIAAAALLGLGAHFANVLADLAADKATSVHGLPQRIAATQGGPTAIRLISLSLLLAASALLLLAPSSQPGWPKVAGLIGVAILAVLGSRAKGRLPFYAAIAIAALDVVLFVSGSVGLVQR